MNGRSIETAFNAALKMILRFKAAGSRRDRNGKLHRSTLEIYDRSPAFLRGATLDEVGELRRALNRTHLPITEKDKQDTRGEHNDIWVFLLVWHACHAPTIDPFQALHTVNGAGKRSNALEKLEIMIDELLTNTGLFPEVFAHMISVGHYLPDGIDIGIEWLSSMRETVRKAWANRNGTLGVFSPFDPILNRMLTEEEQLTAADHHQTALRMIRDYKQRTLSPADYQRYFWYIFAWHYSAMMLAQLGQQLEAEQYEGADPTIVLPHRINESVRVYSHIQL